MDREIDITCLGDTRLRYLNQTTGETRWGDPIAFFPHDRECGSRAPTAASYRAVIDQHVTRCVECLRSNPCPVRNALEDGIAALR